MSATKVTLNWTTCSVVWTHSEYSGGIANSSLLANTAVATHVRSLHVVKMLLLASLVEHIFTHTFTAAVPYGYIQYQKEKKKHKATLLLTISSTGFFSPSPAMLHIPTLSVNTNTGVFTPSSLSDRQEAQQSICPTKGVCFVYIVQNLAESNKDQVVVMAVNIQRRSLK